MVPADPPDTSPRPRSVRAKRPLVFACGKCLKRLAAAKAIRRALKAAPPGDDGRKARLVRTGCLGICPKGAVVVATSTTMADGRLVLVRDAAEAERLVAG